MKRLTMRDAGGRAFWISPQSPGGGYRLSEDTEDQRRLDRLAAYEDAMPLERAQELAQAEKDGRLVAYMPGDKVCDRFGTPWIVESSEIHLIGSEIKHLFRCGHPGTEDYHAMYAEEIQPREEAEAALKKREEAT